MLLDDIIKLRYSASYKDKDPCLINAFQALLRFYITPRLYLKGSEDIVGLTSKQNKALKRAVKILWTKHGNFDLEKLDYLRDRHEKHDDLVLIRHGRYAETHPIVGIG
jgi:hypothetical protein